MLKTTYDWMIFYDNTLILFAFYSFILLDYQKKELNKIK